MSSSSLPYNGDLTLSRPALNSSDMPDSSPTSDPPSDFGFGGQLSTRASPSKAARARPSLKNPIFGNVVGAGKGNAPWGMSSSYVTL